MTPSLESLAAFLKRNMPGTASWSRERLLVWLSWHIGRMNVAWITRNGKLSAVAVARPVPPVAISPEIGQHNYIVDETSDMVHVEKLACKDPRDLPEIIEQLCRRFPQTRRITFARRKRGNKIKIYSLERFYNLANMRMA